VQQRVARLERERRAWRIGVGAVVAGLFLAGATASPGVVDEVRARRIVVVDAQGETRAHLGVLPEGSPALALFDAQGRARATLGVLPDGRPGLTLADAQGTERAILGATELKTIRTGVVERRPKSSLVLFDANGTVLWRAP
jgi:hypothetical protein